MRPQNPDAWSSPWLGDNAAAQFALWNAGLFWAAKLGWFDVANVSPVTREVPTPGKNDELKDSA
jgi:hypothetical protein